MRSEGYYTLFVRLIDMTSYPLYLYDMPYMKQNIFCHFLFALCLQLFFFLVVCLSKLLLTS